ncbi:MAG: glycoside hydrolase family 95 protein, partial [Draconibacterium sp.]|nr:glycoside hydrolase family 95 protein [Draconibacterium sp.]
MKQLLIIALLATLTTSCFAPKDELKKTEIWFNQPAKNWNEAIPIGNGALGGMVYGGIESDTVKINEETLWSGEPRDLQNYEAIKYLPEIRQLLLDGKTQKAEELINKTMLGEYNENYLPMGDLVINTTPIGKAENYNRQLNLDNGIVVVNYTIDNVDYKKEVFASFPDKAIVVKISASKSGQLNFSTSLISLLKYQVEVKGNRVILSGNAPKHSYPNYTGKRPPVYEDGHGMRFQMSLLVRNKGGVVKSKNNEIIVENADEVELILTAATSFNGFDKNPFTEGKDFNAICEKRIAAIEKLNYGKLKSNHVEDYSKLYGRVKLDLGDIGSDSVSINERIKNYTPGNDPELTELYFNFGRYLL